MKLVKYGIFSGRENMQIDSDLLDESVKNAQKEPVFRLYGWSPRCISLGRNQNEDFIKDSKEDVVRRLTGGRALLHDNEVTYSCVFPVSLIHDGESVIKSYKYISGILIDFFKTLGVDLDFGGEVHLGSSAKHDYCMLISTGADVCYNGRKIIGSAQFRKNGYLLQHGSILFGYDKNLLEELFHEKVLTDNIATVTEILPDLTKEEFINRLEKYLSTKTL